MAKKQKPILVSNEEARKMREMSERADRIDNILKRRQARIVEHCSFAVVYCMYDTDDDTVITVRRGLGNSVGQCGIREAACEWFKTDSGVIVYETDPDRAGVVASACNALSGLSDHGLFLCPADETGETVYARCWGNELVVTQTMKTMSQAPN